MILLFYISFFYLRQTQRTVRIIKNMITAAVKITAPTAPPTILAIPKLN